MIETIETSFRIKIFKKLDKIFKEQVLSQDLKLNSRLKDLVDSQDLVYVVVKIEEEFKINISDSEMEKFQTIIDIIDLIAKNK